MRCSSITSASPRRRKPCLPAPTPHKPGVRRKADDHAAADRRAGGAAVRRRLGLSRRLVCAERSAVSDPADYRRAARGRCGRRAAVGVVVMDDSDYEALSTALSVVGDEVATLREAITLLLKEALLRCEDDLSSTVMHNPQRTVWLRDQRTKLRALVD